MHNLRLQHDNNKSNIDFLIVTNQFCCIINCNSHQGNIKIDNQGKFTKLVKKGQKNLKESMYSPIEENRRTELILKNIINNHGLENLPVKSLTVFIDPKSKLNLKQCPTDIRAKVIKVNLLNSKIRWLVENTPVAVYEETKAKQIALIFKDLDTSFSADYRVSLKVGLVVKLFQNWI